ncbi:MAG TPA: prepilin-type N-terminal cleavage/methylation domain-containing protein [Tepidisphaeraceae bacterium]|nr:prepilin-type N-terminal cleavage/methylation domain-containing protein [Tepidisphaeraceae bacterium]
MMRSKSIHLRAFTLVELLVVIGIISLLISILIPVLGRAREQAKMTSCASNLRQVGMMMLQYANQNRGQMFPIDVGGPLYPAPSDQVWFIYVMKITPPPMPQLDDIPSWAPKVLICPSDDRAPGGVSYVLNDHLNERGIKYATKLRDRGVDQVVLMGERTSDRGDLYIQLFPDGSSDYEENIELYRHGIKRGCNALFMDLHAGRYDEPSTLPGAIDPWDVPK